MSELGQKLIAEVRRVAAENPDFIYPRDISGGVKSCVYIKDGCPSCIIGHALWNIGLIDAKFKGDHMALSDIGHVILQYGWGIETGEIEWLHKVQQYQDQLNPWGQAVRYADGELD